MNSTIKQLFNYLPFKKQVFSLIKKSGVPSAAASNFHGNTVIYDTDTANTYSVAVNTDLTFSGTKTIETKIETITLDSFIAENNISKIDHLKIDVETREPAIIVGFLNYIKMHKPKILIEILNDEVGEKVNKMIDGLAYHFYNIAENAGIQKVNRISKSDFHNFLLCNAETPAWLKI